MQRTLLQPSQMVRYRVGVSGHEVLLLQLQRMHRKFLHEFLFLCLYLEKGLLHQYIKLDKTNCGYKQLQLVYY